jgi:hypothetical protein
MHSLKTVLFYGFSLQYFVSKSKVGQLQFRSVATYQSFMKHRYKVLFFLHIYVGAGDINVGLHSM